MNKKEITKDTRLYIRINSDIKGLITENIDNVSVYVLELILKDLEERGITNDNKDNKAN